VGERRADKTDVVGAVRAAVRIEDELERRGRWALTAEQLSD
jgi:hypothetical protein